jgi:hypothetical protein
MLRRYLFIKLKPEFNHGLKLTQLIERAKTALGAPYGVQDLKVGRAVGETTKDWDLCITLMYVSDMDADRAQNDPITQTFEERFLSQRADRVWSALFEHDFARKGA